MLLYRELLNCWKTNEYTLKRGVVCGDDSIAGMWRLLADKTSGFEHVEVGGEKGGTGRAAVQLNPGKSRSTVQEAPPRPHAVPERERRLRQVL